MKQSVRSVVLAVLGVLFSAAIGRAEILAMLNYETKPEQIARREGLAVIDVDPKSETFGKMLMDIPLPPDLVPHLHGLEQRDRG